MAWESLIQINQDELLMEPEGSKPTEPAPESASGPVLRPLWASLPVALAAAAFGLILLGVIAIKIWSRNGETKITAPDDARFKLPTDGVIVEHNPAPDGGVARGADNRAQTHRVSEAPRPSTPAPHATPMNPAASKISEKYIETASLKDPWGRSVKGILGKPASDEMDVPGALALACATTRTVQSAGRPRRRHVVYGAIGTKYNSIGGASCELGLPTSDELSSPRGRVSHFERGSIHYEEGGTRVEFRKVEVKELFPGEPKAAAAVIYACGESSCRRENLGKGCGSG